MFLIDVPHIVPFQHSFDHFPSLTLRSAGRLQSYKDTDALDACHALSQDDCCQ